MICHLPSKNLTAALYRTWCTDVQMICIVSCAQSTMIPNFPSHGLTLVLSSPSKFKVHCSTRKQDHLVHTTQTGSTLQLQVKVWVLVLFLIQASLACLVSLDHNLDDSFKTDVTQLWVICTDDIHLHIVHANAIIVLHLKAATGTRLMNGSVTSVILFRQRLGEV